MLFKDIKNWIVKHQSNVTGGFALQRAVLLAAMVCAIIRSGRKYLSAEIHFIPYLSSILKSLAASGRIVLAVDGSGIGKGCSVLMVSIIWKTRAIPVCWLIRKAPKGHFAQQLHIDIVNQTAAILAPFTNQNCEIIFLGDGEFDGARLQQTIKAHKWFYVLKTAKTTYISEDRDMKDACKIGDNLPDASQRHLMIENQYVGKEEKYGLVNVVIWHNPKHKNPLYLLTNLDYAPAVTSFYSKRFTIETFFGDIKSRGFHIANTKIDNVKMLSSLLMIACLAFLLSILVAHFFTKSKRIDRFCVVHKIKQLSIFQVGFRGLRYCFTQNLSVKINYKAFN